MSLPDALLAVQWRWPAAAAVLLWPALMAWWAHRQRQRVEAYADDALRPWAVTDPANSQTTGVLRLDRPTQWLAWVLLAAALAGPRVPSEFASGSDDPTTRPRHAVDVMVVLDVSDSMRETDVVPDRHTRARLALSDWRRRLHGERVGLIVVAGQAGLVLPLTEDLSLLEDALTHTPIGLIDTRGSDMAAGLSLAQQALASSRPGSRAVLLVTDAESGDLAGEPGRGLLRTLQTQGDDDLPVFVLAVSAEGGMQAGMEAGTPRTPDHLAWHRAAQRSGGALASVTDSGADWDALHDRGLGRLPSAPLPPERARAWRELFAVPLLAALLLWMGVGLPPGALRPSRRASAANEQAHAVRVVASAAALTAAMMGATVSEPARAQPAAAQAWAGNPTAAQAWAGTSTAAQAWAAWQSGQWSRAQALYERLGTVPAAMAAGAAALKAGDAAAAQRLFGRALMGADNAAARTDALYNLGHAHAAQGRWAVAADAWQAVLDARPTDARAAANLAIARAELTRLQRDAPMASDLRGRRGFIAEGQVSTEGSSNRDAPDLPPLGQRQAEEPRAPGALQTTDLPDTNGGTGFVVDARHLASGLTKLKRLDDARAVLFKGVVKQDRSGTPRQDLQPW